MRCENPAAIIMRRQSAVVISSLWRHKAVVKPLSDFGDACSGSDSDARGSPASGKKAFAPLNNPTTFDTLTAMLLSSFFSIVASATTATICPSLDRGNRPIAAHFAVEEDRSLKG
jgi:hypothetical protein